MSLLTISVAALAIFVLIGAWSAVRANTARAHRIDLAKERKHRVNITAIKEPTATTITYDTSAAGLEVDDDLTEEQANVIRMIFEEAHPNITIKNHKEDYWATTEPAGLN